MKSVVTIADLIVEDTPFVRFWNEVLAPKFIRFKHILVDGLTQHSEAIFPTLGSMAARRLIAASKADCITGSVRSAKK